MVPLTQNSLDKLEAIFKEFGFRLRYERGSFRTGACMLQNTKVIVVNRFSTVDMKVQSLVQILQTLPIEEAQLSEKLKPFYLNIKQTKLTI